MQSLRFFSAMTPKILKFFRHGSEKAVTTTALFFALLIVPGRLINRENDRTVREYFQRASRGEPFAQEVNPE